jgi:hypothetical protein
VSNFIDWPAGLPVAITVRDEQGDQDGQFAELVEISIPVPDDLPHFERE